MQVRVLFFGSLRDMAGKTQAAVRLPEGATLKDLLAHFQEELPRLGDLLPSIALSVNQEYARNETLLHDQDEVALLPPVSGGRQGEESGRHSRLVREAIDLDVTIMAVEDDEERP